MDSAAHTPGKSTLTSSLQFAPARAASERGNVPFCYSDSPVVDERGMDMEAVPFTLEVTPRLRGSREIVRQERGSDRVSKAR